MQVGGTGHGEAIEVEREIGAGGGAGARSGLSDLRQRAAGLRDLHLSFRQSLVAWIKLHELVHKLNDPGLRLPVADDLWRIMAQRLIDKRGLDRGQWADPS